jgi:hypothetical protein
MRALRIVSVDLAICRVEIWHFSSINLCLFQLLKTWRMMSLRKRREISVNRTKWMSRVREVWFLKVWSHLHNIESNGFLVQRLLKLIVSWLRNCDWANCTIEGVRQ